MLLNLDCQSARKATSCSVSSVASSAAAAEEMLLRYGYLNGHIGKLRVGLKVYMEGLVNESNGTRVLELCAATDLVITNTYFTKSDS